VAGGSSQLGFRTVEGGTETAGSRTSALQRHLIAEISNRFLVKSSRKVHHVGGAGGRVTRRRDRGPALSRSACARFQSLSLSLSLCRSVCLSACLSLSHTQTIYQDGGIVPRRRDRAPALSRSLSFASPIFVVVTKNGFVQRHLIAKISSQKFLRSPPCGGVGGGGGQDGGIADQRSLPLSISLGRWGVPRRRDRAPALSRSRSSAFALPRGGSPVAMLFSVFERKSTRLRAFKKTMTPDWPLGLISYRFGNSSGRVVS